MSTIPRTEALKPAVSHALEECDGHKIQSGVTQDPPHAPPDLTRVPYRMARPDLSLDGHQLHEVPVATLAKWIEEVVVVEGPVHIVEVASRIARAANIQRTGHRIQETIEEGTSLAVKQGRVQRRGDFLWHPDMRTAPIRDRSGLPSASRAIELVAPEELAEAILQVIAGSVSIRPEEAIAEACRLLGYTRVTDKMRRHVKDKVVTSLLDEGRLSLDNGFLSVV